LITFSNHPSQILKSSSPPQLSSLRLKLALLKQYGVAQPIVLAFTHELSEMTIDTFLAPYSFSLLILGEGDAFGKGGEGNAQALKTLGLQRGFTVQTIKKFLVGGKPVSSTRIRSLIQEGKLSEAEHLLGRPYCIDYLPGAIGTIALPPDGLYTVWSHSKEGIHMMKLSIENQVLKPSMDQMQLISFGPNLNPNIYQHLCQISPAVS
jgi:riboflavin kinase/FMN adenylyltransferase